MRKNSLVNNTRSWRLRDKHYILLLLLLSILFFRKCLFSPSPVVFAYHIFFDLQQYFYPWRLFGFSMLKDGIIPLWNPYLLCGYPFIANWQSAIFYPLNLIFLCMSVHTAINYSFALHVFLSGMFTYFFVRYISGTKFASLIASVTFMFSATLILRIFAGHLSMVCAIPWFPAQLLAVEAGLRTRRVRFFILGGAALAMQLLSGHPQSFFYCLIGMLLYFLFRLLFMALDKKQRKPIIVSCILFAVLLIVGFCLGAVQLMPALEFINYSSRGQHLDFKEVAANSFPPENIITFLIPNAIGDFIRVFCWGRSYLWETAVYIGILPLALVFLALCCVRNRFVYIFTAIALISFIIALGGYTPVLKIFYTHFPGFSLIRGNAKILFLTTFSLSVLAGFGAQTIVHESRERRKRLIIAFCLVAVCLLLVSIIYAVGVARGGEKSFLWRTLLDYRKTIDKDAYWRVLDNPLFTYNAYRMFRSGVIRLIIFLGLTMLTFAFAITQKRGSAYIKATIMALLIVDLWSFDSPFLTTVPVSACWWPEDVRDFFKKDKSMFRFLRDMRASSIGVNQGMNNGFFSVNGSESNEAVAYKDLIISAHVTMQQTEAAIADKRSSNIIAMMNLKYFILPAGASVRDPRYVQRFTNGRVSIFENRNLLPRAYVVHSAKIIKDNSKILDYMRGGDFNPREVVVLEESPDILLPDRNIPGESGEAEILSYTPNEIIIRCKLVEPGLLFLSDTYYPGWKVTVDGRPSRIMKANYAFRAVPLKKGTYQVRFRYQPASFRLGAILSLLALAAVASYLLVELKTKRI